MSEVAINADLTDHNDDSSEIDDSSSEYSDDSSSENDDSSETDSSDVSSESDSSENSDDSSDYEEPVERPQTYTYEVRNEDCAVDEITVAMETAGDLEGTTTVESIMDKDVMCSGVVGLFGEPFDIETSAEFSSAVLTFKVDKSMLGDTEFDNLMFLWYDEENQHFVELDTEHDEESSTVSTTVTHFSKYMIVDANAWYTNWQNIYDMLIENGFFANEESNQEKPSITIGFPAIKNNITYDPVTVNNDGSISCKRLDAFSQLYYSIASGQEYNVCQITESFSGKEFCKFITYDELCNYNKIETYLNNLNYSNWVESPCISFEQALMGLAINGGDVIIMFVTDLCYNLNQLAPSDLAEYGKKFYFLDMREETDNTLINFAIATGGDYLKYSDNSIDFLKTIISGDSSQSRLDSDDDDIPDVFEINGIPLCNGQLITECDYQKPDTDGDDLVDGVEIDPELQYCPIELEIMGAKVFTEGYYFKMNSDPTMKDTDYDGYNDYDETTIYGSNPKIKDVIKHQLKQPFISIEGSFGGNQMWFDDNNVLTTDYIIHKYGCGLISVSDVIFYISSNRGIQSPADFFFDTNNLDSILIVDYMNYIMYMNEFYFPTLRGLGVNGLSMQNAFRTYSSISGLDLSAEWNIEPDSTLDKILEMLDNDIPVTLSIGPDDENGVDFYDEFSFTTKDSYYLENKSMEYVKDHYVTVTGAIENRIKDSMILEISSWGKKYYIDFDEYEVFVAQHSNYVFSNILHVYPV